MSFFQESVHDFCENFRETKSFNFINNTEYSNLQKRFNGLHQRVFTDLQRTSLTRGRTIWLLPAPSPLFLPVSSTGDTQEHWERETIS
jgi:hypothetical protein